MPKITLFFLSLFLLPLGVFAYPGCGSSDMIVWGQVWASCNALTKGKGSDTRSGWFTAGDRFSSFISYNGLSSALDYQRKTTQRDITSGPCAPGYRLPTRTDWEIAMGYARWNQTTLASLLRLPYNGGYRVFREWDGMITLDARTDLLGSYWSATVEDIWPIVLHLGTTYQGYRSDMTDGARTEWSFQWQDRPDGTTDLVAGEEVEIANVRCIRK